MIIRKIIITLIPVILDSSSDNKKTVPQIPSTHNVIKSTTIPMFKTIILNLS